MISRESACLIKIQCSDMDATAIYRHAKIGSVALILVTTVSRLLSENLLRLYMLNETVWNEEFYVLDTGATSEAADSVCYYKMSS